MGNIRPWLLARPRLLLAALACMLMQGAYSAWQAPMTGGEVYIYTQPAGARVILEGRPDVGDLTMGARPISEAPRGFTPGPLPISRLRYSPKTRQGDFPCTLVLRLRGYDDLRLFLPEGTFTATRTRYPESGALALTPRIPVLTPLLYALRDLPFLFASGLLLVGWGLQLRAWRRERRADDKMRMLLELGDLSEGVVLGPYRLGALLGTGGMARVFSATREGDEKGEVVAVKVLSARLSRDADFRERFKREVNICRALRHPNIAPLLDWAELYGHLCIVMERIEGETVAARAERAPLGVADSVKVARQVADALLYAHRQGVVHRDVKPANVMVTPSGKAVLMDFGIARRTDLPVVTAAGGALGTPAYVAPEQLRGETDWRADYYSLGIMLYELAAGRHPYEGATGAELYKKHMEGRLPPLRAVCPHAPEALEALLARMTATRPDDRAREMGEIPEALRRLESDQGEAKSTGR